MQDSTLSPTTPVSTIESRKRKRPESSSQTTRKARKTLSLREKEEILNKRRQGEKACNLSKQYGIAKSTVSNIVKNEAVITERAVKTPDSKSTKSSTFKKVDEALIMWFYQMRSQGIPLSDIILEEKAVQLAFKLDETNFKGSNGLSNQLI